MVEGSDYKPSDPIQCDTAIKQEFVGKITRMNNVFPLTKISVSRVMVLG